MLVKTLKVGHVKENSATLRIPKGRLEHLDNMTEHDLNGLK